MWYLMGQIALLLGLAVLVGVFGGWLAWRSGRVSMPKQTHEELVADNNALRRRQSHLLSEQSSLSRQLTEARRVNAHFRTGAVATPVGASAMAGTSTIATRPDHVEHDWAHGDSGAEERTLDGEDVAEDGFIDHGDPDDRADEGFVVEPGSFDEDEGATAEEAQSHNDDVEQIGGVEGLDSDDVEWLDDDAVRPGDRFEGEFIHDGSTVDSEEGESRDLAESEHLDVLERTKRPNGSTDDVEVIDLRTDQRDNSRDN